MKHNAADVKYVILIDNPWGVQTILCGDKEELHKTVVQLFKVEYTRHIRLIEPGVRDEDYFRYMDFWRDYGRDEI